METIAVIGAGMMGPGIAQVFATHGHTVWVQDMLPNLLETVNERVRTSLVQMSEYTLLDEHQIPSILDRIHVTSDLSTACAHADVVIEAITENLAIKQKLFAQLDQLCNPSAILCSNTSVISITQIGEQCARRERILGTHFWNPPQLIPLVEVVQTQHTSSTCVDSIFNLIQSVGKVPVRVMKDVPGFIANRMQHALWREACAIVDEGICDAPTVDIAVRNSFGMRLATLGPMENIDLVGLDLTLAIHEYLFPHLNSSSVPSPTLVAHVTHKELGMKTGVGYAQWTDESIAEVRQRLTTHLLNSLSRRSR